MTLVSKNNIVYYAFNGDALFKNGILWLPVCAMDMKEDECETHIVNSLPYGYVGGAWSYDGEWSIVNQEAVDAKIAEIKASKVPQTITPRQARLALLGVGLLDEVETLLAGNKAMQIWWEYSLDIQRNHEHIVAMGSALGLTEVQLDDLFIEGAKL